MKLLTEQLRNGQITVEDAILQSGSLIPDPLISEFVQIIGSRINGEMEDKEQAIRDKADEEIEDMKSKMEAATDTGYNIGWNACLDAVENSLPLSK